MSARCRSCRAEIIWAKDGTTGRAQPFDAKPAVAGTFYLVHDPRGLQAPTAWHEKKASASMKEDADGIQKPKHVSHFATCPAAALHRRKS